MGEKQDLTNPYLSANYFSRLTFWWVLDVFRLNKNNELRPENLYNVLPENACEILGDQMEKSWEEELSRAKMTNRKPSLWKVIWEIFGWSMAQQGAGLLVANLCRIGQLMLLTKLIAYFNPTSAASVEEAYAYATGLILLTILQMIFWRQAQCSQLLVGMRVRIGCSSLIYRKILRMSCTSAGPAVNGLIINIFSSDLAKLEKFFLFLPYLWMMPLLAVLILYLVWLQLGVAAFAGILCMMMQIIPIQVIWFTVVSKLRQKNAALTDKRVFLIGEIINGIKVIKTYAWEKYFERLVYLARKQEIAAIMRTFYVRGVSFAMAVFTDRTALLCAISVHVWLGHAVTPDKIFSSVGYFVNLRLIAAKLFAEAVFHGSAVKVAFKRMEKFLLRDEVHTGSKSSQSIDDSAVLVKNVYASWGSNPSINHIDHVNLRITPNKLHAVVGPVGSGKSSLLKLILGELQPKTGQVFVNGKVSYASQEPWLFTGSVRDNILFGDEYNEERYNKVIDVCQLTEDFQQLPFGDRTLVGERGMSLSGGQCARVSLARAVYKDVDIYLFDDPLSAVDLHVGRNVFDQCINGLLKDKIRILVTHRIQYLKEVDEIIILKNGRIEFQGDYETFIENEEYLDYLSSNSETENDFVDNTSESYSQNLDSHTVQKKDEENQPKETEELDVYGRSNIALLIKYFKAGGSYVTLSFLMLLFFLAQLVVSAFDYWLSFWTIQEEKREEHLLLMEKTNATVFDDEYLRNETALYVSGSLVVAIVFLSNLKNFWFFKRSLSSSKTIHNIMFSRLLRAPMRFFSVHPSGRMLNRFSKDTGTVDEIMPSVLIDIIERVLIVFSVIIQISIINWWIIGPILIAAFVVFKISNIYFSTSQTLKRIESNARSPVFSLVHSTILGLPTIRSCRAQNIVRRDFDKRQDANTSAFYLCVVTNVVYGMSLDILLSFILGFMVYTFIPFKRVNIMGGDVGLALTQFFSIFSSLQFVLRQIPEFIYNLCAVNRMFQYTILEQEGPFETTIDKISKDNWPSRGAIKFENVQLRYSKEEQLVLKNLNVTIASNMKVGIVGRTGAGKSSLIAVLFRLAEFHGSLLIDDVDTREIGLLNLRSKMSIIPQEPAIFSASLRDNLDPLRQYDDNSIWSALEQVDMKKVFESLEQPIDDKLSAGQRQLLCLARAIVRRNKILVLDEATANIDPVTDELIQKTIRTRFKDCTVLTIAHRLSSVIDSDAILVMDAGKVVEFDRPHVLLQKEQGYLVEMVKKSGSATCLKRLAEEAYGGSLNSERHTTSGADCQ